MILHRSSWLNHSGASHRMNFDTPSLRGNSGVAWETPELLTDGVEVTQIQETREFPGSMAESWFL